MPAMENNLPNLGPIRIKQAEPSDVDGMARCHIAAFPGRFMTEMGPRWITGLYHHSIQHKGGISLVAVNEDEKVLGFAVGGDSSIREEFLHKAIFRYPHILLWKFFTSAIVRRTLLTELFRKLHFRHRSSAPIASAPQTSNAARIGNLLSIAVSPQLQGTGIADQLVESFQKASAERGYDILTLGVLTNNLRAVAFYKKHAWHEVHKYGSHTKFQLELTGK